MKNRKLKVDEIVIDKPYLLEENYCPNIGFFPNGPSKDVSKILNGSNVYRYDIYNYCDDDRKIINLGGGDPIYFDIYKYVKKDLKKLLKHNCFYKYTNTIGDIKVKESLIDYLKSINIKNMDEDNIIVTSSTTHAYSLIMKTIIKPNDVIIIPTPTYGLFTYLPEKLGGKVIFYELKEENDWKINPEELNKLIINTNQKLYNKYKNSSYIPKVVAIYNQNPNNPMSVYMSEKDMDLIYQINKICYENKVLIIDDMIYKDSIYEKREKVIPMSVFNEFKDNIISIFGISKSFSLSALRSGFIVANKYIIQDIRDSIFLQMDSIPLINQIVLASIYNNDLKRVKYREKFLKKINEKYILNLNIIKYFIMGNDYVPKKTKKIIEKYLLGEEIEKCENGIKNISFYHNKLPVSGFFAIIDFTKIKGKRLNNRIINNDRDLIMELYKNYKIKFLPGSSFGWNNKNEIIGRITFSKDKKELIKDMLVFKEAIEKIK